MTSTRSRLLLSAMLATSLTLQPLAAIAQTSLPVGDIGGNASIIPTGQVVTPTAAPGSTYARLSTGLRPDGNADAQGAVKTALSPDGKTLLVLTSGYNQYFADPTTGEFFSYPVLDPITGLASTVTNPQAEWVFVFDVSSGALVKKQQINIPNTYNGLVWAPDGKRFYVSAGIDDRIYVYKFDSGRYVPDAPFILLGHNSNQTDPFPAYDGGILKGTPADAASGGLITTGAVAAGLDISRDGKTLVVANFQNDSISIIDTASRTVIEEIKFFVPGGTVATGELPFDVAIYSDARGAAAKVFVTSQRDDEVLAVDLASKVVTRIPVGGQPNKLVLSANQGRLYVANGNSDSLTVIDPVTNNVVRAISLSRPGYKYKGSNPNAIAFSPDGKKLYVTLGGENAVAVVDQASGKVEGRIPTGWYPNSVSVIGSKLFVVNAKSNVGPNPSNGRTTAAGEATNTTFKEEYNWALEKAGISTIPVPGGASLARLSARVDKNNGFGNQQPDALMAYLRTKIKHVIYVVKENRTYDQVLGDLPVGNGDPSLTLFPEPISPNHHKLATDFVILDNFYNPGESSGVGWSWSTYARTTDYTEKTQSVLYGNANFRGLTYDYEGTNRNISVGLPQTSPTPNQINTRVTGVLDPSGSSSILPGTKDANAPEGDGDLEPGAIGGYLWDAALRAGKTVRNYGFFIDLAYYGTSLADPTVPDPANPLYIPITRTPFASGIPQAPGTKPALLDKTDIYFRGYDQKISDIFLYEEWKREFDGYVANNNLPNLQLVRIMHDHFGSFDQQAVAGLDTAETQMADNDYALGKLVEAVSKSIYWKDTAIVVLEDDSQDGPDHVDGHRSIAYVISPYTKRGALVSTNYTTVSALRTIEDLLGLDYLGMLDANTRPMADVFTRVPNFNTYTAVIPGILCAPPVDPTLVPECADAAALKTVAVKPLHDGQWWAKASKGFNFSVEDKLDVVAFNRLLWQGIKGTGVSYPEERNRKDLRNNRTQLLNNWTAKQPK
ncbi:alkaline phosphatase family protein [Gloeobacter violaceus]|uniref:Glr0275 protein n=1 Tax=Gloeobacter violaceus (strain ATCC 29082 / PCC 7421) TaxID=251221 RepID=Q7NNY3_GLOVI|nr:alkaline phosphatase family protein [Gloeobacter violaceus]BAC88216.1 glr0275 [Gloeobacter violaceus PCC 7421]